MNINYIFKNSKIYRKNIYRNIYFRMLIYDYVLYNGEPILEFRLKYLYDYVDKFIIVESIYTYAGNKKDDLYYNINHELFKQYEDKIIFFRIENIPWIDEIYTRNYVQKELNNFEKKNYRTK